MTEKLSGALVVFAKTIGLSSVKTRLAAGVGKEAAERFYELSLKAVEDIALVVKEESKMVVPDSDLYGGAPREDNNECGGHQQRYDPPLPTSMLEVKSTRGKHSTEKPVALMEWILKIK